MVGRLPLSEGVSWARREAGKACELALFAVSLYFNVTLGWQVHRFRSEANKAPHITKLTVGAALPSIRAKDLEGNVRVIDYANDGRPTVLYVFTPACEWCKRNAANVTMLARKLEPTFRFIGISLSTDVDRQYLTANRIAFPVYTDLPEAAKRSLGLGSTPQTIVVSPSGRVMANWVGAYGPDLRAKIERFFRVRLPGLTDETAMGASASSSPPAKPTSPR